MKKAPHILIVEDIAADAKLAEREICKVLKDCTFHLVETRKDFLKALETFQPDVILSDYTLPRFDGLTALKLARKHAPFTPLIIWTDANSEDTAVDCLKAGANNYVLKENIKRLGPAVIHALKERELLLARRQAEVDIQNNEKRFRALLENGLDDISLLAADGTLLWESPSAVHNLGYAPAEFLQRNIFEIMHPDDLAWTQDVFAKLIHEPDSRQNGTFRLRRSDGTWRWVEAIASNMLNEPSVNAIVINYRDITARKQAEDELVIAHDQLKHLFDNLDETVFSIDTSRWQVLQMSPACEKVYGRPPSEFLENAYLWKELILPEDLPVIEKNDLDLYAGKSIHQEYRIYWPNGEIHWLESSLTPTLDAEGRLIRLDGICANVTERKKVEKALRASEEKYRFLFDNSPLPLWIYDRETLAFLRVNHAAARHYGYSIDEFMSMTIKDIRPSEDVPSLLDNIANVTNGIDEAGIWRHRKKDGTIIQVEIVSHTLEFEGRSAEMVLAIDVTERNRAEDLLQEERNLLRTLIDNIPDRIYAMDIHGRKTLSNTADWQASGGRTMQDVIGKTDFETYPPDLAEEFWQLNKAVLESGQAAINYEEPGLDAEGKRVSILTSKIPLRNSEGNVIGLVGIGRDITQRKQTEARMNDLLAFNEKILNHSAVGILTYTFTGECIFANEKAASIVGASVEQLKAKNFHTVESWRKSGLYDLVQKAMATQTPVSADIHMISTFGKEVWMTVNCATFTLKGEDHLLLSASEISDRKQMEEKLRQSENRHRLAIKATNDVIWESNLQTTQLFWSENAQIVFGYLPEEVNSYETWWEDHLHPDDRERVLSKINGLIEGDDSIWVEEYRFHVRDGSYVYISDRAYIERDANGTPLRMIGAMTDITERKQAEDKLRESENRLFMALSGAQMSVWEWNLQTNQIYWSPEFFEITGVQADQLGGTFESFTDLIHNDDVDRVRNAAEKAMQEQTLFAEEFRIIYPDGEVRWLSNLGQAEYDSTGSHLRLIGTVQDVTQRKQAEIERQALLEIMQGLANTEDLHELLTLIHRSIAQVIYARNFFVVLHHPNTGLFEEIYSVDQYDPPAPPAKLEKSITSYVFRSGNPLLLTQALFDELAKQGEVKLVGTNSASWLGVPLKTSGRTIGVMVVQDYEYDNRYTERDKHFLASIAAQVALVIERRQTEQALTLFRSLIDHSSDVIEVVDPETGRFIDVNEQACRAHGYTREEYLALSIDDIDPLAAMRPQLAGDALDRPDSLVFESMHRRKDGSVFPVEVNLNHVRLDRPYNLSVVRDITERKQAEEALHKSEALYRQAIEVAGAVPYYETYYDEGRLIKYEFIGEGIRQITGYGPDEFSATLWDSIVEEINLVEDLAGYSLEEGIQRVRTGQNSIWKCEHRIRARDGKIHWVFEAAVELRDQNGISYGSIGTYQDITERKRAEQALRESEEHYRAIFEGVQDAILVESLDGKILMVNEQACEMFGYSQAEFLTKAVTDLVPAGNLILMAEGENSLLSAEPHETLNRRANGEIFPIDISGRLQVINGETVLLVVVRDITERKKAEALLQESENRFSSAFEYASIGMALVSPEGRWLRVNWALCELVGYSEEELSQKSFQDITYPDDLGKDLGYIQQVLAGEIDSYQMEKRYVHRSGQVIWVLLNVSLVRDHAGRPLYFISQIQDITERKQAEESLRAERAKMQNYLDIAGVIMLALDQEGTVTLINQKGCEILGYSADEIIGKNWMKTFLPESDREELQGIFQELISGGIQSAEYYENAVLTRRGEKRLIAWHNTSVRDAQGRITSTLSSGEDITERKRAEEALREAETKYRTLVEQLPSVTYLDVIDESLESGEFNTSYISPQVENLLGYPPHAFQTDRGLWTRLIHPEDRERVLARMAEYYENRGFYNDEYRMQTRKGSEIWIRDEAIIVHGQENKRVFSQGVVFDITERKLAETALIESNAKFRGLFEASPDAILLIDPNNEWPILDCNTAACQLNGFTREELIGQSIDILNLTAGQPHERANYLERIRQAGVLRLETVHRHKNGTIIPIEVSTSLIRLGGRDVILGIDRDVTERKRMEVAEHEQRALAEALRDTAMILSSTLDYGEVLDHILSAVGRVVPHEAATIMLIEDGYAHVVRSHGYEIHNFNAEIMGIRLPLTNTTNLRQMVETRQPVVVYDTHTYPGWTRMPATDWLRSSVGAPISIYGEMIGFICLDGQAPEFFTPSHAERLEAFANQAALAIHNAGLLQQAQEEISERKRAEEELRFEKERIEKIATAVPGMIGSLRLRPDGSGCMPFASPAIQDVYGFSPADLEEDIAPFFARVHSEDLPQLYASIQESARTMLPWHGEFRYRHPIKGEVWIEGRSMPLREEDGSTIWHGFLYDITERKRAEQELRASEERFRQLADNIQEVFWMTDAETGQEIYISPAAEAIWGQPLEAFLHEPNAWINSIFPEDRALMLQNIEKEKHGEKVELEYRIVRPDGSLRWVWDRAFPIFDDSGKVKRIAGISADITERRESELALVKSQSRYRELFDSSPVSIWEEDFSLVKKRLDNLLKNGVTDLREYFSSHPEEVRELASLVIITDANQASLDLYKVERKQDLPKSLTEALGENTLAHFREEILELLSPRKKFVWEGAEITPDGRQIELVVTGSIPQGYEEDWSKVIVSIIDITERKQAEESLRESEARYHGLFQNLVDGFALHEIVTDDQCQPMDYIFLEVNPAFERMTGLDAAQITGRRVTEVLPGVVNEHFVPIYGQVALTGEPVHFEDYSEPLEKYFEINAYSPKYGQFAVTFVDITERKQAENEIRRRAEVNSILLKTSLALTNLDLKATLQTVGDSAKNLFAADGCRIFLMEPDGKFLRCVLALQESSTAFSDLRVGVGEGVTGAVVARGQAEIVNEMQNDPRSVQVTGTPEEEEAIMFAPLKERDNTIGVLSVRRTGTDRPFELSDLALLEALASMAASAVSNARLFAETQRRLSELEALYENGLAVGRLLKPTEIGNRIINTFARYLAWHHVTIRLRQDVSDNLELVAFNLPNLKEEERTNTEQHFIARINKVGQGLSGWVIQTGIPLRTGNVYAHPQYVDTHAGIQSGLYMPLKVGEQVVGVISVESEVPDAFTEQDERLLATLASQAAIAFENARLYQAIEQELSERKRAEEALRASETHYRALADSITDILFEFDHDLCYTHWNKASEIFTGIPAEDAIGKPMREILGTSEEQTKREEIYKSVLKERQPRTFEMEVVSNGQKQALEINAYPSVRGALVVAKDVTDRKRSEVIMQKRFELMEYSAHHALDELMQRTVDEVSELTGSTIGFFHFVQEDQNTLGMQTWSTNALHLFNVPISEGAHLALDQAGVWAEAVHQRRPLIQNDYEALAHKKGLPRGHVPIRREIIIPIIRNEKVMAVMGIGNKPQEYTSHDLEVAERLADYAWDITERKQMQVALEMERNQLARRVEERTSDLSQANSNLARALRVKDEFLANMSHELRTPLNAILGLSESLGEQIAGPLNEKQQKYITTISESGHHLLSLINDILDLAKIEAGQITLDINKVDIHQVCQASLRMIKQLAQKKNQDVVLEIGDGLGLMWADERRLKQMIVNLMGNAVKFTPEHGKIGLEVRGDQAANKVTITVWDNGIGIREEDLTRLFQPFVQLDSGLAREATGTGLGLALVAQMARLHGGSVTAVSEAGKGSRFSIILPWEPALAIDTASRLRTTGKFPAIKPDETNKPTILLVEDTNEVVMMIRDYLELAGYKVVVAQDGVEAITQARLIHPDLILMDVMMPRMDGFEATRKLRSEPEFKYTPIIALTALAMPSDRERCLAAGMDEYISKPINLKALIRMIQSCLFNSKEPTSG